MGRMKDRYIDEMNTANFLEVRKFKQLDDDDLADLEMYSAFYGQLKDLTVSEKVKFLKGIDIDYHDSVPRIEIDPKTKAPVTIFSSRIRMWTNATLVETEKKREIAPDVSDFKNVPRFGEQTLLLFLSKEDRDILIGDLEEEFFQIADKHGVRYARGWYWKQTVCSCFNAIWSKLLVVAGATAIWKLVGRLWPGS